MVVKIINGRKVGVTKTGKGDPMLMLHPALAHRGALTGLMAKLDGFAFTAIDLPGHGDSEFCESVDIQLQTCENAITLLEQAGTPSHIFGHSFGATVALKVALLRPDLVRSLCLYEPVYFSLLAHTDASAYEAEIVASSDFVSAAESKDWPNASRAFLARWSTEGFDTLLPIQQAYILRTTPLIVASTNAIIAPASGAEILSQLPSLKAPILLIRGEKSPEVTNSIIGAISRQTPKAQMVVVPDAGHMGPITHSRKVGRIITGFLESLSV